MYLHCVCFAQHNLSNTHSQVTLDNMPRLAISLHPACHTPLLEWVAPSPCSCSSSSKESWECLLLTAPAAPAQCCPCVTEARDNISLVSPASHIISSPAWNRENSGRIQILNSPKSWGTHTWKSEEPCWALPCPCHAGVSSPGSGRLGLTIAALTLLCKVCPPRYRGELGGYA